MFMAGSLIILSQPQTDSHNHSVCLCMSPAAFLSLLKRQTERERGEKKKKKDGSGANKWCSVGSMQSRAGRYDQDRTYREETHREIIQQRSLKGTSVFSQKTSVTAQWHHSKHLQ